ncbi:MAG: protein translocase subunit SecD, partial [Candidatus Hydrogenedentes bacterium]|nr:protein translocase subunit SecD [Candidatus Hydrogenedentota bacterium]
MKKHTYRTLFICVTLVIAAIYIYPTVGWMLLSEEARKQRIEAWEEEDRAVSESSIFGGMARGVKRWAQFDRDWVINLGLDLQGGVHMVVGFDSEALDELEQRDMTVKDVQEMVLQRIRNRVNEFEAKEPIIQALGTTQVQIQLPGEKDVQRAQELIMQTAFLTFHLASGVDGSYDEKEQTIRDVHKYFETKGEKFAQNLVEVTRGVYRVPAKNFERVNDMVEEANEAEGLLPETMMFAFSTPPPPGDNPSYQLYLIEREPGMTGEDLTTASATPDDRRPGSWKILFAFGAKGVNQFAVLTAENRGREMAIVLDGRVVSAPTINEQIVGNGEITGSFDRNDAKDLAISLNSGSMPVPIHEDYSGVVDASLGADSVQKGVFSSIVGLLLVMVFMIIYYRAAGLIANVALTANALLVIGALAYFNATLTLPGIAGLILTIGMAVDANVLIFERIREELRNGKSLISSIEGGYARATITILDANVTTLIAALVLTQFGTGPVQGFAVTLSIGVCASVFAALIVTRSLFDFLADRKTLSQLTMMSFLKARPEYKFIGRRKLAALISAAVIVGGLGMFAFRGGNMFGVDFKNGTNMRVAIASESDVVESGVRARLADAGFASAVVQAYTR